ncbi:MAG: hypothetical protein ABIQ88_15485 [Chitinophagaceae bacterium]
MAPLTDQPRLVQAGIAVLKFISNLLKSIWLFFPSILFILLTFACFIKLGQGKDILISFTENHNPGKTLPNVLINILLKLTFFVAIAFWAYVSWYSSRIVAYGKLYRQKKYANQFKPTLPEDKFNSVYEIQQRFLDVFPRLAGYGCFAIILLSVADLLFANSWLRNHVIASLAAFLFIIWLIDKRLIRFTDNEINSKRLRNWFTIAGIAFLALLVILEAADLINKVPVLFAMTVLLMIVYTLYINLRRIWVQEDAAKNIKKMANPDNIIKRALKKLMTFIHVDHKEYGYFLWFNIISFTGFAAYLAANIFFTVSVALGPMPLVLLAFAVLLGFGNIITILSLKTGVNLHFIVVLLAALVATPENHLVRTVQLQPRNSNIAAFKNRQNIQEYFTAWVQHHPGIDSASEYPVYFVLGNGGASRSAYWVASVLGRLEDNSIQPGKERFSEHVFCLSGTSGGGVGVAAFYSLLKHADKNDTATGYETAAKNFLGQDFLTYTLARLLGADYFNYIPVLNWLVPNPDRADALESAFEKADDNEHYKLRFDSTYFDQCITQKNNYDGMPILCINSTRVQDGNPGVLTSIQLTDSLFNKRVDVLGLLAPDTTIRLSTAAILGARFPYMSPAGRIDQRTSRGVKQNYFVDGGYFDNSGAGIVQEMIRAIIKIAETTKDPVLSKRMKKMKLVVLHITNSPQGNIALHPVTPFKNDLASPLLTILGAYDMQTTVNDMRLASFTSDVNSRPDSAVINKAEYYPIHLYNDLTIRGDSLSNGPYAMNWFISDSVLHMMNRRLETQPRLNVMLQKNR